MGRINWGCLTIYERQRYLRAFPMTTTRTLPLALRRRPFPLVLRLSKYERSDHISHQEQGL